MESTSLRNAIRLAFDSYLDAIESSDEQHVDAVRDQRRLCGRWLITRRTQLRLSEAMIEERTGIELHQLVLFEAGLASRDAMAPEAWHCLALVLEDDSLDLDWVTTVMFGALGELGADASEVMAQVAEELEDISNTNEAAFQEALRDLNIQSDAFFTVMALLDGPLDVYGIVKSVAARKQVPASEIRMPDIPRTLDKFEKSGYVSITPATIGQHTPSHEVPIYRLTVAGEAFTHKLAQLGQLHQQIKNEKRRVVSQERQLQQEKALVEQFFLPLGLSL